MFPNFISQAYSLNGKKTYLSITPPPPPPFPPPPPIHTPPPPPLPPSPSQCHSSLLNTHYQCSLPILTTNTHCQCSLPILTTHASTTSTLYTHYGKHPPPSPSWQLAGHWLVKTGPFPARYPSHHQTTDAQGTRVLVHVERLLRAHPCRIVDDAISFQVDRVLLGTYYILLHSRNLRHLRLSSLQKHTSSLYVWASSYI